jgi:hypothetical protein
MYLAAKTLINNNDTLIEVSEMSFLLSLLLHVGAGSTLLDLNCAAHLRLLYNIVKEMGYRYGANGVGNRRTCQI